MEKELEGKEGEEREEATNAIAGALCGMVELYMTDLWWVHGLFVRQKLFLIMDPFYLPLLNQR